MSDLTDELRSLAIQLRQERSKSEVASFQEPLNALENAAARAAKAWSGSSIGFHANVYYDGLQLPPPGAHFSQEWGFLGMFQGTTGEWREYQFDAVRDQIIAWAHDPDTSAIEEAATNARRVGESGRATLASIFSAWLGEQDDPFIASLRDEAQEVHFLTHRDATAAQVYRGQVMTRDTTALGQGFRAAPHQDVIGLVLSCRQPFSACEELADVAERAAAHIERIDRRTAAVDRPVGGSIFIGHGRSLQWRELKDFVQDRLGLQWDEFNRVPVAGVPNILRLSEMLDGAGLALLVCTAEDEMSDGTFSPRLNVVHEAGLFQGRLGFTRAIVLLEEGCEEFSNIAGLGQIRFPVGQIGAAFEEVRQVLEREGFV